MYRVEIHGRGKKFRVFGPFDSPVKEGLGSFAGYEPVYVFASHDLLQVKDSLSSSVKNLKEMIPGATFEYVRF